MTRKKTLVVVIVLYGQKATDSESFCTITPQLAGDDVVFLVDNSPVAGEIPAGTPFRLVHRHCPLNIGVSGAYNMAFAWCMEQGFETVLLSDQDTRFPPGSVAGYRNAVPHADMISAPLVYSKDRLISPYRFHKGYLPGYHDGIAPGKYPLKGMGVINSGLLLSLDLVKKHGGYHKKIALDWSDVEFSHGLGKAGVMIELLDLRVEQNLSVHESVTMSHTRWGFYLAGARLYAGSSVSRRFWLLYGTGKVALKYTFITRSSFWLKSWFSDFLKNVLS
jgi:GT2 family glycosyltransferase